MEQAPEGKEIATLAGGCFWCLEAVYDRLQGVESVESGYMGGQRPNPSYEAVCNGDTGHAEVVRVTFDPKVLSYLDLLEVFFVIHDPTTLNRQGNDVGSQYRSAIFYHTPQQKAEAEKIFTIFYRVHGHQYRGAGMGLAVCKKIMELHGGFIETDSDPEKGATFTCYFPEENF